MGAGQREAAGDAVAEAERQSGEIPAIVIETSSSTALAVTAHAEGGQTLIEIQALYRLRRGRLRRSWLLGQRVTLPSAALPELLAALTAAGERAHPPADEPDDSAAQP